MISACLTFLIVGFYSQLVEKYPKDKLFSTIPLVYGAIALVFAVLVYLCQTGIYTNKTGIAVISYLWFSFLESWGALLIASFWGTVSDTTEQKSAARGMPLIYLCSQVGGVFLPSVVSLPHKLGLETDLISMIIMGLYFAPSSCAKILQSL